MFCNKCGAELKDTATFCNKCGNQIKRQTSGGGKKTFNVPKITVGRTGDSAQNSKPMFIKWGAGLLGVLIVVTAVILIFAMRKPVILGTWQAGDLYLNFSSMGTGITTTGDMHFSGSDNIFGNDTITFFLDEEDGTLSLWLEDENSETLDFSFIHMDYELARKTLTLSVDGQTMVFHRQEFKEDKSGNDVPKNKVPDTDEEDLRNFVDTAFKPLQILALYDHTWTDASNTVSFAFGRDGKIKVVSMDMLEGEFLNFYVKDSDTLSISVDKGDLSLKKMGTALGIKGMIAGAIGDTVLDIAEVDLDYDISGGYELTFTFFDQEFRLFKKTSLGSVESTYETSSTEEYEVQSEEKTREELEEAILKLGEKLEADGKSEMVMEVVEDLVAGGVLTDNGVPTIEELEILLEELSKLLD